MPRYIAECSYITDLGINCVDVEVEAKDVIDVASVLSDSYPDDLYSDFTVYDIKEIKK